MARCMPRPWVLGSPVQRIGFVARLIGSALWLDCVLGYAKPQGPRLTGAMDGFHQSDINVLHANLTMLSHVSVE